MVHLDLIERSLHIGLHFTGRALRDDFTGDHEAKTVTLLGFLQVMGNDYNSSPPIGELVDHPPHVASRQRVHAGGGLIQKVRLGLVHHSGAKCHPLLPAARERLRQHSRLSTQLRSFEHPFLPLFAHAFIHAVKPCVKIQVLADGEVTVKRELLRHVSNPGAHLRRA